MVQDKKNFSSGKKPMAAQDLDKKGQPRVADKAADTSVRSGNMKQQQSNLSSKDKSAGISKTDTGPRK